MAKKRVAEPKKRNPTSFRLWDEAEEIITKLSKKLGQSRNAVLEQCLRRVWAWEQKHDKEEP